MQYSQEVIRKTVQTPAANWKKKISGIIHI